MIWKHQMRPRGGLILSQNEDIAKAINKSVFPGIQGGPLMHVIAAKAVAFKEALSDEFKTYQFQIIKNAKALGESLSQYGFKLLTNGTDNHLVLVDLRNKQLTGKVAEHALDEVGITANKNAVPFDTESPFITSGLRMGTAAVTARGFKEADMAIIGEIIHTVLADINDTSQYPQLRKKVEELCRQHPLYANV